MTRELASVGNTSILVAAFVATLLVTTRRLGYEFHARASLFEHRAFAGGVLPIL